MRIVLTPGEPAGIGPDICLSISQQQHDVDLVVFADPELLLQRAGQLGITIRIKEFNSSKVEVHRAGDITVYPVALKSKVVAGELNPANSAYVLECLQHATRACITKEFDALVTGPVHKGIINDAGIDFSGHTEYLAKLSGCEKPVMMLQTPALRVALVTTHLPLKDVSQAITAETLSQVLKIIHHDLSRYLAKPAPSLFVAGLNPHAGENGHLGSEEITTIIPTLERLRQEGLNIVGPLSADTMFSQDNRSQADVFVCMYHDQGLPVLKYQGFGEAVNITLGLPFIRTSVDHGTALSLAGTGQARHSSLAYAIDTACNMANVRPH